MASKRRDERPTGNGTPVSACMMGQRPHPMVLLVPKDVRFWLDMLTRSTDVRDEPVLPSDRSGFRKERIGSMISHHLRASAEYIIVNVGGSGMNAKVSSPPTTYQSVGGPIVVRGRESRLHGEGGQGIDIQRTK
jgi:hypothetical protein